MEEIKKTQEILQESDIEILHVTNFLNLENLRIDLTEWYIFILIMLSLEALVKRIIVRLALFYAR